MLRKLFFVCLGVYILPTNGRYRGTEFELLPKDPTKPADQYAPKLNGNPGLNYFDNTEKYLYIVVKGPDFIEIRTTNVVQVWSIFYIIRILCVITFRISFIDFFISTNTSFEECYVSLMLSMK